MTDVRRVRIYKKTVSCELDDVWNLFMHKADNVVDDDEDGTHALMEWEGYKRLRNAVDEILHAANPPSDMSGQEVCDWLREMVRREIELKKLLLLGDVQTHDELEDSDD
jgi:hypothetical protein